MHVDEKQMEAAIARLVAYNAEHKDRPDIAGRVARLNIATLPPFLMALTREINSGAERDDLRKASVALVSNILMTIVDTNSGRRPGAREAEIEAVKEELAHCFDYALSASEPQGTEFVRGQQTGRA